jgi:hypothetical protein
MRRPAIWLVSLSFSFSAAGLSGSAIGQDRPAAASARAEDTVLAEVRRGRGARDAGKWVEAEAAFKAALAAGGSERTAEVLRAEITGELGLCELRQGKHRDAAEHLARSLARREALAPALRRRFEEGQRSAERHVERVYLGVSPLDAEVFVDGKPIDGRARSYRLVLEPGHHTIRAQLIGHGGAEDSFESVAGKQRTASLVLRRAPDPAPRTPEPAPVAKARIPAPAPAAAAPPSSAAATIRTTGVVLTGAAAAVGAVSFAWAAVTASHLQEESAELHRKTSGYRSCAQPDAPGVCDDLRDARARLDHLAVIGWASLATSGALGATTLAAWVLTDGEPDSGDGVRVAPLATAGRAGVVILGSW